MTGMTAARAYTTHLAEVISQLTQDKESYYYGEAGALSLAREYGMGLIVYSHEDAKEVIMESFGTLCLIGYNFEPPIDDLVWLENVLRSYNEYRDLFGNAYESY
jgi:hypothetical protein